MKVVEKDDRYILYNVATDSLATIYKNDQSFSKMMADEDIKNFLVDNLIMIEEGISESSISRFMINKSKYADGVLTVTDAITYKCNLECVYCMQQNTFRNVVELPVEERLFLWKYLYDITNSKCMDVYFFGGEPFLFPERIRKMLEGAKNMNINVRNCYSITNGVNISKEVIDILNEYDFKHLQITLDGMPDVHNSRRKSKLMKDSFSIIIKNIRQILEKTNTNIIINTVLDRKNLDHYFQLVKYLEEIFAEYLFVNDSRISFNVGEECHPVNKSVYTIDNIATEDEYSNVIFKAMKYMINRGLIVNKPIPTPICIYRKENDVLISPDGDLYKCITGLGVPEFRLMKKEELFSNPLMFFLRQANAIDGQIDRECEQCEYLSLCNGGCKFNAFNNGKKKVCNKTYLNKSIDSYIEIMEMLLKKKNELVVWNEKIN